MLKNTLTAAVVTLFFSFWCVSASGEIVIGHQVDLKGGFASWGFWIDKAAKAAVDEINKEGGVNGQKLVYMAEDTESDPKTGVRKFKKLVLEQNSDVVLGSVHSGVMMATLPVAKELKTPYFPIAMSCEGTGTKSNGYVFRLSTQVCSQVRASVPWVLDNVLSEANKPSKWVTIVSDYAWGQSHEEEFTNSVKDFGGEVLTSLRVPTETIDYMPYIRKIPKEADAIYFVFFGQETSRFLTALNQSGVHKKLYTVICSLEAINIDQYKDILEGAYVLEYLPRRLEEFKTAMHEAFRNQLGVNPEGFSTDDPKIVVAGSHYWAAYEHVQLIAQAMKDSGYKSKEDRLALIKQLENIRRIQESSIFPQGDAVLRMVDHQGFHAHWMSQVFGGKLISRFKLPLENVIYDARSNLTKRIISD